MDDWTRQTSTALLVKDTQLASQHHLVLVLLECHMGVWLLRVVKIPIILSCWVRQTFCCFRSNKPGYITIFIIWPFPSSSTTVFLQCMHVLEAWAMLSFRLIWHLLPNTQRDSAFNSLISRPFPVFPPLLSTGLAGMFLTVSSLIYMSI